MITGNVDRLSDDEINLLIWVLSNDVEGDLGRRSSMGGIMDKSALGYEPVRHARLARIQTSTSGGTTDDVGFRCGEVFVKVPKHSKNDSSMEALMIAVAGKDRAGRAMLRDIRSHLQTLRLAYVSRLPATLEASLRAFADLAPLVAETAAAMEAHEASGDSQGVLAYCQALSARVVAAHDGESKLMDADAIAMQEIAGEADALLSDACRCVKSSLRRHAAEIKQARSRRRESDNREAGMNSEGK